MAQVLKMNFLWQTFTRKEFLSIFKIHVAKENPSLPSRDFVKGTYIYFLDSDWKIFHCL